MLSHYLKHLISSIVIVAASKFAVGQEKEFKKIKNQINSINSNNLNQKELSNLFIDTKTLINEYPSSPLGYFAKSQYYSLSGSNVDSAYFILKRSSDLFLQLDEKTQGNYCKKFDICPEFLNKKLDSLSISSFAYYSKSIESINIFLNKYPKDVKGYLLAKKKLVELNYKEMNRSLDVFNYKKLTDYFLERFPNSDYQDSILNKIEYYDLQIAIDKNTIEKYNFFLEQHPVSKSKDYVLLKIEKLEYQAIKESKSTKDFSVFLEKYPNSIFKTEIEKLIEEQRILENTYNTLKTVEDCKKFISEQEPSDLRIKVSILLSNYERLEEAYLNAKQGNEVKSNLLSGVTEKDFVIKYFNYLSWLANSKSWSFRHTEKKFQRNLVDSKAYKLLGLGYLINEWVGQQVEIDFFIETNQRLKDLYTANKKLDLKECLLFYNKHFDFDSNPDTSINLFLNYQTKINDSLLELSQIKIRKLRSDIKNSEDVILSHWAYNNTLIVNIFEHWRKTNYYSNNSLNDMRNLKLYSDSVNFSKLFLPVKGVTNDTTCNPVNKNIAIVGEFQNTNHYSKDLDGFIAISQIENGVNKIKFIKEFGFKFDNIQMDDKFHKVHIDKNGFLYGALFSEGKSSRLCKENRIIKINDSGDTIWTRKIETKDQWVNGSCVFLASDTQNNLYALYGQEYDYGGFFTLVKINQITGEIIWIKEYLGNHVSGILGGARIHQNTLYFIFNFTHDFDTRSIGKPFNPFVLIVDSKGQEKVAKPILCEEPKLITSLEIESNTIVAKGIKGELNPRSAFFDDIELINIKYKNSDYPYYLILDFMGNIIKTNGME